MRMPLALAACPVASGNGRPTASLLLEKINHRSEYLQIGIAIASQVYFPKYTGFGDHYRDIFGQEPDYGPIILNVISPC
jgi:hypothetical protein